MKKAWINILALALCLSMVACSGGDKANDNPSEEDSPEIVEEGVLATPEEVALAEEFPQWYAEFNNDSGHVLLVPKSNTEVEYTITLGDNDTMTGIAIMESDTLASNDEVIIELVDGSVQITVKPAPGGDDSSESTASINKLV